MYRYRTIALFLILVLSTVSLAPAEADGEAEKILGRAMASDGAWRKLAYLCDRIGARLSGSRNLERAVEWSRAEFRRDGLEKVWTEEVQVPHWVRGPEEAEIVSPARHPMALSALGGSIATPPEGITAEVVEVNSFHQLRALGESVRGKIVLYNKEIFPGGGRERGYGSAARFRVNGAAEAAKQGAVATLVRSLGTADFRLPHTGMMRYEEGVPRIPSAAVSAEDAELIHRLLASGDAVRVRLALGCSILPDATSHNVIADLPGRELPEEIILIGCHIDSWDVGTGAIDDGVGCAMVMETMRLLKASGLTPRRTVRAVLFTSEENGIWGGKRYAEVHAGELDRHVAAMEFDAGDGAIHGFGVTAGEGGLEIVQGLAVQMEAIGASKVEAGGGGPDISPMRAGRVPMISARQETGHYFDYHHSAADTLDKVDPEVLRRNTAIVAAMTWLLADSEETLPRTDPPE